MVLDKLGDSLVLIDDRKLILLWVRTIHTIKSLNRHLTVRKVNLYPRYRGGELDSPEHYQNWLSHASFTVIHWTFRSSIFQYVEDGQVTLWSKILGRPLRFHSVTSTWVGNSVVTDPGTLFQSPIRLGVDKLKRSDSGVCSTSSVSVWTI